MSSTGRTHLQSCCCLCLYTIIIAAMVQATKALSSQFANGFGKSCASMSVRHRTFVLYLDPIFLIGRRCPSPGDPRGLKEKAMRRLTRLPSRALRPDLIGPQVGTPPIIIGAFERQGACPQLVFESCASALHFRN